MMDTYLVEYYTTEGKRIGVQVSAYCSYDAEQYARKMPDFSYLVTFPEKIRSGYDS